MLQLLLHTEKFEHQVEALQSALLLLQPDEKPEVIAAAAEEKPSGHADADEVLPAGVAWCDLGLPLFCCCCQLTPNLFFLSARAAAQAGRI
jgi:hypothetical protein